MKEINFTAEQIKKIYEISFSISESRSKKRQNIINEVVKESLKLDSNYVGCEFKTEVRIPKEKITWGEFFPVDICVYKDGNLIEIILNKAPASNIKQNRINSLNGINSEIIRLSKLENIKITLINFLPKKTPFFKIDETIKNFETNTPFFLTTSGVVYKFDIDEIYILFEINNLEQCESKTEVKQLFIENPVKNINILQQNYKGLS
jgi:hypothetical protein